MRIGTWNLNNQWGDLQRDLLLRQKCDVWLLTEVSRKAIDSDQTIAVLNAHLSLGVMARKQHWAAILSHDDVTQLPDPHPASAAAVINGVTYCSTILPWRSAGSQYPWIGVRHAEWTEAAIATLLSTLPKNDLIWGGDWNHALVGPETAGSKAGRNSILAAIESLELQVPTAQLPHRLNGEYYSIDHIAVPRGWRVDRAERIVAEWNDKRLSDHDVYVVEVSER